MSLISKDEPLATSMVHIGYLILKQLESTDQERLSLASIMFELRKKKITHYRSIMFGLIFLYTSGAIEFRAPYILRR